MLHPRLVSSLTAALLALPLASGCATARTASTDSVASVDLSWPEAQGPRAHKDAFQNGAVKMGLITLSPGAELPEHSVPLPAVLLASSGHGTVKLAKESQPLDSIHAVFLPPGSKHSVIAAEGEPLRIAVVVLKGAAAGPAGHPGHAMPGEAAPAAGAAAPVACEHEGH